MDFLDPPLVTINKKYIERVIKIISKYNLNEQGYYYYYIRLHYIMYFKNMYSAGHVWIPKCFNVVLWDNYDHKRLCFELYCKHCSMI